MAAWSICGAPARADTAKALSWLKRSRPWLAAAGGLVLAGCGTDLHGMLAEESRLTWQAQAVVAEAALVEPGSERLVFDAETAKQQACAEINHAVMEEWRGAGQQPSAGEGLVSDLTQFAVRLFPVESVERCAEAHQHYRAAVVALRQRVVAHGVALDPIE